MALTAYMSITPYGSNGEKEAESIKGSCVQAGREGTVLVYALDHLVEIPKDTHTGLPTGQRIHHPIKLTKKIDQATPYLYKACCTGQQCEVIIDHYRIKEDGTEDKYYTIKLDSAIIVTINKYTPLTFLPENKPFHDMEEISFTYSEITWTYHDGTIEYVDDWKTPSTGA